jgi:hypothetical protein
MTHGEVVYIPLYPPLLPFTPTDQPLVMMIPSAIAGPRDRLIYSILKIANFA